MELAELQAMWQQYDSKMSENIRINKEILKRMLRAKPERRLNRMKGWALYGIAMPIPVMCIVLIPNTKFRNEWDFYLGLTLVGIMLVKTIFQVIQHYRMICAIDLSKPVTQTKKQLAQLEQFRMKMTKWGFATMFIGMVGIGFLCKLPVMTPKFAQVTLFIILLSVVSSYIHVKRFKDQINTFNAELDEIEELEKE